MICLMVPDQVPPFTELGGVVVIICPKGVKSIAEALKQIGGIESKRGALFSVIVTVVVAEAVQLFASVTVQFTLCMPMLCVASNEFGAVTPVPDHKKLPVVGAVATNE